jgi:hypothetical protein
MDATATEERGRSLYPRRVLELLFVLQIVINILFLTWLAALQYRATHAIADLNHQQIAGVSAQITAAKRQNNIQICAQHDLTIALRKIGLRLGLPVEDIRPPTTKGIDCDALP